MKSMVLSAADLELVLQWFEEYKEIVASDPLGGQMTSVEAKLGEQIHKALKEKRSWEVSELDVGWLLEWSEKSVNPTHGPTRLPFGHEADLIDKLNLLE